MSEKEDVKSEKVRLFEKLDSIENRIKPLEEFIGQFRKMIEVEKEKPEKKEEDDDKDDNSWFW